MSRDNDGDNTSMKGLDSDEKSESASIVTNQDSSPFKVLGQGPEKVRPYEKILHAIWTDIEATVEKSSSGVVRLFQTELKGTLMS